MNKQILGIIGGSGLYDINFLKNKKKLKIRSLFSNTPTPVIEGEIEGNKIYFLTRHGEGHRFSPSEINYCANIDCLKKCGVTDLISISAVGSLKKNLPPGKFVLVDQFIDRTFSRKNSFFTGGIVAHVPMAHPTSKILISCAEKILKKLKIKYQKGGTYVAIEGPQFSTKSESNLFRKWNADVIGMTNMPEAKLAREAEIRYCSVAMVTDYDCWYEEHSSVNVEILIKNLNENSIKAMKFIHYFAKLYYKGINFNKDDTEKILDTSIVTHKKLWNKNLEKKLISILKRYKQDNK